MWPWQWLLALHSSWRCAGGSSSASELWATQGLKRGGQLSPAAQEALLHPLEQVSSFQCFGSPFPSLTCMETRTSAGAQSRWNPSLAGTPAGKSGFAVNGLCYSTECLLAPTKKYISHDCIHPYSCSSFRKPFPSQPQGKSRARQSNKTSLNNLSHTKHPRLFLKTAMYIYINSQSN